jgi:hypothetical protein
MPNSGQENSLMPLGTCQPAEPGTEGALCPDARYKDATPCNAGLVCNPIESYGDTFPTCTQPNAGTEGGLCEGRTETECADGLTCVRENASDLEGTCTKQ